MHATVIKEQAPFTYIESGLKAKEVPLKVLLEAYQKALLFSHC
jgi:hypothetical protein